MSKVEQLKEQILQMPPEEFAAFCTWYETFRTKEQEKLTGDANEDGKDTAGQLGISARTD